MFQIILKRKSSILSSPSLIFQLQNLYNISLEALMASSFSVKKTQEKHKQQLREIKPATNTSIKQRSLQIFSRDKTSLSYARRYQIDLGNSRLVNRILNIARSNKLSKFKQQHFRIPIQRRNIIKNHKLQRQNAAYESRIKRVKPAIGSIEGWKKDFQNSAIFKRKSTAIQKTPALGQTPIKQYLIKKKIERQASLNRRTKGNSDDILSLPHLQIRLRYKTEIQGQTSNPGTMR